MAGTIVAPMDPVPLGLAIRTLRRRHGWTQHALADRAGVSQSAVSRAERGEGRSLTLRTLERIAEALGARVAVRLYWHGEELDRLLDAAHAGLVDQVVALLRASGWDVVPEATFSIYGERGSVDVLAYHPEHGALLVIEVKSAVPDMQLLLAGIDRKGRLAPGLARGRGWDVRTVSRLLACRRTEPPDAASPSTRRRSARCCRWAGRRCGTGSRDRSEPPAASCSCHLPQGRLIDTGLRPVAPQSPPGSRQP